MRSENMLIPRKRYLAAKCLRRLRILLAAEDAPSAHRTIDWFFDSLQVDEEGTPLEFLRLNSETCAILAGSGILSVETLCEHTERQLRRIKRLGKRRVAEINRCLGKSCLSLVK